MNSDKKLGSVKLGNVASPKIDASLSEKYNNMQESMKDSFLKFISELQFSKFRITDTERLTGAFKFTLRYEAKVPGEFREAIKKKWPTVTITSDVGQDYIVLPHCKATSFFSIKKNDYVILALVIIICILLYMRSLTGGTDVFTAIAAGLAFFWGSSNK
jgi:hypothetical protein